MKKLFTLIICLISLQLLNAQLTAIPDPNFEQALINLGYDTGIIDGIIPTNNIDTIISLNVVNQNISDLTGIEDFAALKGLNCSHNPLTTINISNNINLDTLNIRYAQLNNLDVSQNINLIELDCYYNQLDSLDITQNISLNHLECDWNNLTYLDVSQNINLKNLSAYENDLININLSNNNLLETLHLAYNQLTTLDLTSNPYLTFLECSFNQLSVLNLNQNPQLYNVGCAGNLISTLDLSNNIMLQSFWCDNNNLNCINVKNGATPNLNYFWVKNNPNLTCIEVNDPSYWTGASWLYVDTGVQISNTCNNTCSTVGITEDIFNPTISLYPNPAKENITIELRDNETPIILEMINIQGQILVKKSFNNTNKININVNSLPKGIYFVTITEGEKRITRKFLKQ